ncbi:hypothetical protein [Sediminibacterium sp.]|uniref:hypothetical protein n=1 Tax=Sediminibacterium sp. TaxID=1917865 RepID=UPI0025F62571|nr:hypothetical protein [Sediminibacterium sp.]MBW0176662.1 hypothetical protein [Sediminibacterium sp.]
MSLTIRCANFCFAFIAFLCAYAVNAQKQHKAFTASANAIKNNMRCCSAAFPGSGSFKATTVLISEGGAMTIVYNNGRPPVSFNLYELYKNEQAPLGLYYKTGSRTVEFRTDEMSTQAIRFNTAAKAKDTYNQIRLIVKADHENYRPGFPLTISQTTDSINSLLRLFNNDMAEITVLNDTVFKTSQMPSIRYNIDVTKLKNTEGLPVLQVKGIGFIPYIKDGFGTGARIVFQNGKEQLGFLQFTSGDRWSQTMIYRLLIHLTDLMRNKP